MIVLHDPETLLHDTVELLGAKTQPALECPERIKSIVAEILESSHDLQYIHSPRANKTEIATLLKVIGDTHGQDYLHHLGSAFQQWRDADLIEQNESVLPECFAFSNSAYKIPLPPKDIYARAGFFAFDMSSGIMQHTYTSIIASANLAFQATRMLSVRNVLEVFALCRPPGHHCDGHRAGGYCYVNNVAVAISTWRERFPDAKIAVLDIDFHHGNGTQELYYKDPKVFYASVHGEGEFPYYTGWSNEKGHGEAIGSNLNLPLQPGSSFEQYMEELDVALSAISTFNAEFLAVSLGFDTFRLDPLGKFEIDTPDYQTMANVIRERLPEIPTVILLEGGYSIQHLGGNALSFLKGWELRKTSQPGCR